MSRRADEVLDGVQIRRVALYPSHDASAGRRLTNYVSFGVSALVSGTRALRGVDALWINYSPITVAWAMWWARYAMRIPIVIHVLDLWPDTVLAGGFGSDRLVLAPFRAALNQWCGAMYRAAHSVAYISPGVGSTLEQRRVPRSKLHYVPMWADEDLFRPSKIDLRVELGIEQNQIVLVYAGTMGHAQGLESLVDACALVDDPRFVCLIAGSGTGEQMLRDRAAGSAANIRFLGRLPKERMSDLMATGDLHYVGLRSQALSSITMPSKIQATLSSGRALLVAAEGDAAAVALESGAGFAARPNDSVQIAARIRDACRLDRDGLAELGDKGRLYYDRTFAVDLGVDRIEALLESAATSRRQNA